MSRSIMLAAGLVLALSASFSCRSETVPPVQAMMFCDLGGWGTDAEMTPEQCSREYLLRIKFLDRIMEDAAAKYAQLDQDAQECERDLKDTLDDLEFEQDSKKPLPADLPMIRTVCGYVKDEPDQRFCQVIVNDSFFRYETGWSCEWHQGTCAGDYFDLLDKKSETCGGYITCQREPSEITPPPGPSAPYVPLIWRGGVIRLHVPGYSPRDNWM